MSIVRGASVRGVARRMINVSKMNFRAACEVGVNSSGEIAVNEVSASSSSITGRSPVRRVTP